MGCARVHHTAVHAEAEHLALSLYLTFLDPDANLQVNVPATVLRNITALLDPGRLSHPATPLEGSLISKGSL